MSQNSTIRVVWQRSAIDWLSSSYNLNKTTASIGVCDTVDLTSQELETTSIVQVVLSCGLGKALKDHLTNSIIGGKGSSAAAATSATAALLEEKCVAELTIMIQRFLEPKLLGQRIGWLAPANLARLSDAEIIVEEKDEPCENAGTSVTDESHLYPPLNGIPLRRIRERGGLLLGNNNQKDDEDEDDDDDDEEDDDDNNKKKKKKKNKKPQTGKKNSSSSATKKKKQEQLLLQQEERFKKQFSEDLHFTEQEQELFNLVLSSNKNNNNSHQNQNQQTSSSIATTAASASNSSSSSSSSFSHGLHPFVAAAQGLVDETPQWSLNSALAQQQQKTSVAHYVPSATPTSFVDEMIEAKSRDVHVLPLIVGSVSRYLGAGADRYKNRHWTLYIRGVNMTEDLASIIDHVVFHLHESFEVPRRVVKQPPFEIQETGWGQFVTYIEIHFKTSPSSISSGSHSSSSSASAQEHAAASAMVVTLNHFLRFDQLPGKRDGPPPVCNPQNHHVPPFGEEYFHECELVMPPVVDGTNIPPAVWEEYDEIVFVRPPTYLRDALIKYNNPSHHHDTSSFSSSSSSSGIKSTKSQQPSVRKDIEQHGVPTAKLVNDEAEYKELQRLKKALQDQVEKRMAQKLQQQFAQLSSLTTTSQVAAKKNPWIDWRRLAESVITSAESEIYDPL